MELAKVEIRLNGSLANTVVRHSVTPAELLVLRELHGDECLASINWQGKVNTTHEQVLENMRSFYNTESGKKALERLFPGASPKLPPTFKDIGYDITEEGEIATRKGLQKKYEDELTRKVREAAVASGKDPADVKIVSYDEKPAA